MEDALAGLQAAKAAGMRCGFVFREECFSSMYRRIKFIMFVFVLYRCIAVTTTLSSDKLLQENPSLIKKDIGDIKLDEILNLPGPGEY